jgi:hypothetical protein
MGNIKNILLNMYKFVHMKKRGSHVGIALSFGIFIIFLVFLLSILSPLIREQESKQHILDNLENELINSSTENLTTFSVHISNVNPSRECIKIKNIVNNLGDANPEMIIIKDESQNILEYSISGDDIDVKVGTGFSGFLKIYYSDKIESSMGYAGSGCAATTQYSIGLVRTGEYNFDGDITELLEKYDADYNGLKQELGIPQDTDFGFDFTYSNETVIGTQDEAPSTSVYSDQTYVTYMDRDANLNIGYLTTRVW